MATRAWRLLERYPGLVAAAVALALAAAADPRGEFPLNDDWAFAHSVQWLLAEHRIRVSDWAAMNLLPQTLAGAVVAQIAGFSFSTLRHLTQAVSAAVALLALRWFLTAGLARRDALFATLTVVATPCWLPLADSFMTDLYAMAFALPAATLLYRALRDARPALVAGGAALAAIGVLQRQVVIVVPVAFLVASVAAQWRRPQARALAAGVLPALVAIAAEALYYAYLAHGPGVPQAQRFAQGRVLPAFVKIIADGRYREWVAANLVTIGLYLGLFAAPFAWWRTWPPGRPGRVAMLGLAAAVAATMALTGSWPPWRGDQVIDAAGIGPFVLYDAQPRGLFPLDRGPGVLWYVAGASAAFGVAAICRAGLLALRRIAKDRATDGAEVLFLCVLIAAYVGPFVITDYFDRYLLFVLPFVLALMARVETGTPTRLARGVAVLSVVAALALGTMATHDYFAWNRARWDAIRLAGALGATPATLDGGFEYNGYYRHEIRPRVERLGKSWWWVDDDRFIVTFGPVPGYVERAAFPVRRWLSRTPSVVRLLERAPS
ncbi:MAG TPA: hypothetical protein VF059_02505 [Casimicrobiaceae bacterium]